MPFAVARLFVPLLLIRTIAAVPGRIPIKFGTTHSVGDVSSVDEVNTWQVRLETAMDGVPLLSGSRHRVNRYRYEQTLLEVGEDGRAESLKRRYLIATNAAFVPGGIARPAPRKLQGCTVRVTRDHGQPTIAGLPSGDDDAGRSLAVALDGDLDYQVLQGRHAVGDSWSIPNGFQSNYVVDGTGQGTCHFVGMTSHGGIECANVAVEFRLKGTDERGRALALQMSGTILWSPNLRRTVSVYLLGPLDLTVTRRQGSASITTHAEGTARLSREIRWTSLGGKAVGGAHL